MREVFETAERITGIPAPRLHPSPATLRLMARLAAVLERLLPLPSRMTREGLQVVAGVTYLGSNEKARRELGFAPRPLEEGLRETLAHEMAVLGLRRGP